MYERVVRFSDVTPERMEQLLARVKEAGGPPPGVNSSGIRILFDASQGSELKTRHEKRSQEIRLVLTEKPF